MNKSDLAEYHKKVCADALEIALQRGTEYSNDDDELRTFRDAGYSFGCAHKDVARMQLCLKIARLKDDNGLVKMDTIHDIINYAIYMSVL